MNTHVIDVSQQDFATQVEQESHTRPVLVDYWAAWCGPCKALAPILERVVDSLQGQIRLAKVDTDANQTLATEHGIRSLPTVRLYRDGQPVAEFMGAQPESQVRDFIQRFAGLGARGPLDEARERFEAGDLAAAAERAASHLESHPDDTEARILLAEIALAGGDPTAATRMLESLPDAARVDPPVPTLLARAKFAEAGKGEDVDSGGDDLESCFQRAMKRIATGDVETGMDALLGIVRADRSFRDDGARKALIDAFTALGADDPRVAEYRGRLFSLLH